MGLLKCDQIKRLITLTSEYWFLVYFFLKEFHFIFSLTNGIAYLIWNLLNYLILFLFFFRMSCLQHKFVKIFYLSLSTRWQLVKIIIKIPLFCFFFANNIRVETNKQGRVNSNKFIKLSGIKLKNVNIFFSFLQIRSYSQTCALSSKREESHQVT